MHGLWVCHDCGRLLFLSPPQTRCLRVQVPLCGINARIPRLAANTGDFLLRPQVMRLFLIYICIIFSALTSDLLLQAEDHRHGLMQHQQFGLWLLALQMQLTHVTQLLEGLVDVPHAQAFTGIVGHPPLALTLCLLLWTQVFVFMDTTTLATSVRFSDDDLLILTD